MRKGIVMAVTEQIVIKGSFENPLERGKFLKDLGKVVADHKCMVVEIPWLNVDRYLNTIEREDTDESETAG